MIRRKGNCQMEKFKEYLLIGAIILFAVIVYVMMPEIFSFVARHSRGTTGALYLLTLVVLLAIVYYLMGYRGRSLAYVVMLLLFVGGCIWLYFNYRDLDVMISDRFGQGAATIVFLLLIAGIWLFTKFML